MNSYIIVPAEHISLVDLLTTPCTKVSPMPILSGEHEGKFAMPESILEIAEFAILNDILAQEPLLSTKLIAELSDSDFVPEGFIPEVP